MNMSYYENEDLERESKNMKERQEKESKLTLIFYPYWTELRDAIVSRFKNNDEIIEVMQELSEINLRNGFTSDDFGMHENLLKLMSKFLDQHGYFLTDVYNEKVKFIPFNVIESGVKNTSSKIVEITFSEKRQGKYYWNVIGGTNDESVDINQQPIYCSSQDMTMYNYSVLDLLHDILKDFYQVEESEP